MERLKLSPRGRKAKPGHNLFVEDGTEFLHELALIPGVIKVKTMASSGRSSKIRRAIIRRDGATFVVIVGCSNGHQSFRVFGSGITAEAIESVLQSRFKSYEVTVD